MANQEDMVQVLEFVDDTAKGMGKMGWFDQYSALMGTTNVREVVLCLRRGAGSIIAAALTYTPVSGSQIAGNLPWAGRTGDDVGGVTCICIRGSGSGELSTLLPHIILYFPSNDIQVQKEKKNRRDVSYLASLTHVYKLSAWPG